jgi:hypothetical protein
MTKTITTVEYLSYWHFFPFRVLTAESSLDNPQGHQRPAKSRYKNPPPFIELPCMFLASLVFMLKSLDENARVRCNTQNVVARNTRMQSHHRRTSNSLCSADTKTPKLLRSVHPKLLSWQVGIRTFPSRVQISKSPATPQHPSSRWSSNEASHILHESDPPEAGSPVVG